MRPRYERATVIPDVHGDLQALKLSLNAAKRLKSLDGPPRIIGKGRVVFLGDYIDRGPQSTGVLEFLREIRAQAEVILLRGNHEGVAEEAGYRPTPESVRHWIRYCGAATLADVARQNDLPASGARGMVTEALADSCIRVEASCDYEAAFAQWQSDLRGRLRALFASMKLLQPLAGGKMLAVHAGVPTSIARRSARSVHQELAWVRRKETYEQLNDTRFWELARMLRIYSRDYGRNGMVLSPQAARELKQRGCSLIIRGHEVQQSGVPTLQENHGVHVLHLDVGMCRNMRANGQPGWGYAEIDDDFVFIESDQSKGKRMAGYFQGDDFIPQM